MAQSNSQQPLEERSWEAWLRIYLAPRLGLATFYRLLAAFRTPRAIAQASLPELLAVPGVSRRQAETLTKFLRNREYSEEINEIRVRQIGLSCLTDEDYPDSLRHIYQPPPILYRKGSILPADANAIAVVGTRRTTAYGLSVAERLAFELAQQGITIVSGLARGIDQAAHQAALKAGGRTIAVLGSGLANVYPRNCSALCSEIAQNGAILSEFPLQHSPFKGNFPRRNRIIAGLALGVLIVEAPRKSGALITANYALEQGKEVFAIPGKITSPTSQGTNQLLQMGAKLVTCVDDIFEEIQHQLQRDYLTPNTALQEKAIELGPDIQKLYDLVTDEPQHIDTLCRKTGWTSGKLASHLIQLEMNELVKQLPGKMYIRVFKAS